MLLLRRASDRVGGSRAGARGTRANHGRPRSADESVWSSHQPGREETDRSRPGHPARAHSHQAATGLRTPGPEPPGDTVAWISRLQCVISPLGPWGGRRGQEGRAPRLPWLAGGQENPSSRTRNPASDLSHRLLRSTSLFPKGETCGGNCWGFRCSGSPRPWLTLPPRSESSCFPLPRPWQQKTPQRALGFDSDTTGSRGQRRAHPQDTRRPRHLLRSAGARPRPSGNGGQSAPRPEKPLSQCDEAPGGSRGFHPKRLISRKCCERNKQVGLPPSLPLHLGVRLKCAWEGRELGGTEDGREASTDVAPGVGFLTTVVEATRGWRRKGRGNRWGGVKIMNGPTEDGVTVCNLERCASVSFAPVPSRCARASHACASRCVLGSATSVLSRCVFGPVRLVCPSVCSDQPPLYIQMCTRASHPCASRCVLGSATPVCPGARWDQSDLCVQVHAQPVTPKHPGAWLDQSDLCVQVRARTASPSLTVSYLDTYCPFCARAQGPARGSRSLTRGAQTPKMDPCSGLTSLAKLTAPHCSPHFHSGALSGSVRVPASPPSGSPKSSPRPSQGKPPLHVPTDPGTTCGRLSRLVRQLPDLPHVCRAPGGQLAQEKGCPLPGGLAEGAPEMPTAPCSSTAGLAEAFPSGHTHADVTAEAASVLVPSFPEQSRSRFLLSPNVIVKYKRQDCQVILADGLGLSLPGTETADLKQK